MEIAEYERMVASNVEVEMVFTEGISALWKELGQHPDNFKSIAGTREITPNNVGDYLGTIEVLVDNLLETNAD